MKLVAYTNDKAHAVHIGGKLIMPGETREVDETLLPTYSGPAAAPEQPSDRIAELIERGVKDIVAELRVLDDQELEKLEKAELAGKARKTLLEAISVARIRRASGDEENLLDLPLEKLLEAIKDPQRVPTDELDELFDAESNGQGREEVLEALSEEEARRAK